MLLSMLHDDRVHHELSLCWKNQQEGMFLRAGFFRDRCLGIISEVLMGGDGVIIYWFRRGALRPKAGLKLSGRWEQ